MEGTYIYINIDINTTGNVTFAMIQLLAIDDTKYDDNEIKKLYTENETQKLKELFEERNTNDQRRSEIIYYNVYANCMHVCTNFLQ